MVTQETKIGRISSRLTMGVEETLKEIVLKEILSMESQWMMMLTQAVRTFEIESIT